MIVETDRSVPDALHAAAIASATGALNAAMEAAGRAGLDVTVDVTGSYSTVILTRVTRQL